ncbi:MAG: hypothetical protein ACREJO_10035 [Phycisphaerales bacterium]
MPPTPTPQLQSPSWTLRPEHAAALESLLRDLTAHHEAAVVLCREHRTAIARADHHAIGVCVMRQQTAGSTLAELDLRRMRLVAAAVPAPAPAKPVASKPADRRGMQAPEMRLSELAAHAPGAWRERLLERAESLREVMRGAAREQEVLRQASESLLSHMKGLMAQVSRQLSATGTYARTHTPPEHAQVLTGIDLTT